MKVVITECNLREQEKRHYVIDSSVWAYKIGRLLSFVNLSKEIYTKQRDKSMRVQAISKYRASFFDDIFFSERYSCYEGKHSNWGMIFNSNATYKEWFTIVKNISITRLNKAIKKMQKWENILYKDFEYIITKR